MKHEGTEQAYARLQGGYKAVCEHGWRRINGESRGRHTLVSSGSFVTFLRLSFIAAGSLIGKSVFFLVEIIPPEDIIEFSGGHDQAGHGF